MDIGTSVWLKGLAGWRVTYLKFGMLLVSEDIIFQNVWWIEMKNISHLNSRSGAASLDTISIFSRYYIY